MSKETCDGIVALHIEIKINPADFYTWDAERIRAYFDGLAKAIAAANGQWKANQPENIP